ncbi:MAG TPA: AAA family ATPase [Chlamydiales bacterium]|nr:AAA family ATPase [Chlamydiales bacterium]
MQLQAPLTARMPILLGPRGVGKTTTLVQVLLDCVAGNRFDPRILYIQADHFCMESTSLYEISEQFKIMGGKWIVFDEIHKYPNWSKELKSIYDTFPNLQIFASGSSALEIHKGSHDLSRRGILYHMQGLSFREYLELNLRISLPFYPLQELCARHEKISNEIVAKVRTDIIPEFRKYLKFGYYPYFHELKNESIYMMTLEQNIHTTIESDLSTIYPQLTGISIQKIKKLLIFIANSVPFIPNWSHIMTALEIGDLRTLKTYFSHLDRAGLIQSISKSTKKFSQLEGPSKVYLKNTNQLYAISSHEPQIGTVRETFFLNMVAQKYPVQLPLDGDFLVDQEYLFEVGGRSKNFNQIKSHRHAYLVCDDLEQGAGSKMPLWLFGFLY